jgi:putative ABC transport system substrate-binding protein
MSICLRRRDFIVAIGGAAAWPLTAKAQQAVLPVVGYLGSVSPDDLERSLTAAFLHGLEEGGYRDGRNVLIEYRWANGSSDRLPALARDLVGRAAVIATYDTASALAAKSATMATPIIFATGADPIRFGIVASFARPGGNITGVSFLGNIVGSKRLGLLRELAPKANTFGFLIDPSNPNAAPEAEDMLAAANLLGHKLVVSQAGTATEIDAAFTTFVSQRVDAVAIAAHAFFGGRSRQLADLSLRHRLPTVSYTPEFAAAGGLMSYGGDMTEAFRQQGIYTARILKGERTAELPVQQVIRFKMVLNLKAAKALGLTVPPTLVAIADDGSSVRSSLIGTWAGSVCGN